MGKYIVEVSSRARKELQLHYQSGNKSDLKKIEQIFLELSETPYEGTGNPEPLKYHLAGYWSRRINRKDRIVYRVFEYTVLVLVVSAIGRYGDKETC
jgi:toxin YoeB